MIPDMGEPKFRDDPVAWCAQVVVGTPVPDGYNLEVAFQALARRLLVLEDRFREIEAVLTEEQKNALAEGRASDAL